jgi:hypothetical protein
MEGVEPTKEFKPFLLDAGAAIDIARAIPGPRCNMPILQTCVVGKATDANGHAQLAVTDLENARVFTPKKPEGIFPDIDRVIPKGEPLLSICFSAQYLADLMSQFVSFTKTRGSGTGVTLHFLDHASGVRIEADGGAEQHMTAVLMPMRDGAQSGVAKRLEDAEAKVDRLERELDSLQTENANLEARLREAMRHVPGEEVAA